MTRIKVAAPSKSADTVRMQKTALQAKLDQIDRRIAEIAKVIAAQRRCVEKTKAEGLRATDARLSLCLLELQLQQEMEKRGKLAAELNE
ncbi:MAG: hypothetical protein WBX25_11095 [Rhodomicrobium sp.]